MQRSPSLTQDAPPGRAVSELAALIVPILQRFKIRNAALFGSVARGEAEPESDLDLLVEYSRGTTLFDIADLKQELEQTLSRNVDLVSPETLKPRLREHVLKEQVQFYSEKNA